MLVSFSATMHCTSFIPSLINTFPILRRLPFCATMAKRNAPAAERNKEPILRVLQRVLPSRGHLLEISSGTGQHVAHFAANMKDWTFQPSEFDKEGSSSIDAWTDTLSNVKRSIYLDVRAVPWPVSSTFDAVFNANMIHISPWATTKGIMSGANRHLKDGGILVMYGPYIVDGKKTAESNLRFDQSLKSRNSSWGVRELREVEKVAEENGMKLKEIVEMPANNLCVVYEK